MQQENFAVIPAIDILDGKVVRLTKGDYGQVEYFSQDPVTLSQYYQDQGAKRLHIVDLDGAKLGKLVNRDILKNIRSSVKIEIEFGGGVRTWDTLQEILDMGINQIIFGSILIKNFDLALEIIETFPNQIIAGIDCKQNKVAVEGWTQASVTTAQSLITSLNNAPIHSIIYTDIERDGTLLGPNMEILRELADVSKHPIIASGGVGSDADIKTLAALASLGITGCIVGKALLTGAVSPQMIQ